MPTPDALRTVATVAEVLGEHGVDVLDIRDIDADSDGEVVHAEVRIKALIGAEQPAPVAAADETGGDETTPDDPVDTAGGADAGDGQERHQCPDCEYTTDSERGLNIHRSKAHGDHDDVWCGICGDGPFAGKSPLAGHHNGAGHEGDLHPVDEAEDDGTTGGGSEDTAPEREFADVAPDWLDERSFHEAAELSADLEELTTTLGWDDRERLAALVKVTDVDVAHTQEAIGDD